MQAPSESGARSPFSGDPTCLELRWGAEAAGSGDFAGPDGLTRRDGAFEGEWCRSISTMRLVASGGSPVPAAAVREVTERLPSLRTLTVLLEGAPSAPGEQEWGSVQEDCGRRGVRFALGFVLDESSDVSAALTRRPNPLTRVLEVSQAWRDRGLAVQWWIPLLPALVFRLETLFSLAGDEGLDPILVPPELPEPAEPGSGLEVDERTFAWDFITYRLLDEEQQDLAPARANYYRALRGALEPEGVGASERETRTPGTTAVAVLCAGDPGAPSFEVRVPGWPEAASTNGRDSSGFLEGSVAHALDVGGVLFDGCRGLLRWAWAHALAPGANPASEELPRALLIGAYGGEHIGDAAILGGVLLRVHERYATRRAILMSQRPAHTRRLVSLLDLPVSVEVREYEHAVVRQGLAEVDGVVYAGGPLTDLPKQLVRHLYTASLARRQGKPLIVEGIGAGPFVRRPSAWVGRRIVKMAHRLSVRTSGDGEDALLRGLQPEVGRDPAFDYLETRPPELTRLPEADRAWIDRLLEGTEGRPVVGVNLRPIKFMYTIAAKGQGPAAHTRSVESIFEDHFAAGIQRFHEASTPRPCFVFYPMNAIQFGFSDLRSAYRVRRRLGEDVDFRIWEGDASLDGVVALLRRVDLAVSMRFHGTIFALSQDLPVIGIDYRIGHRDKVAKLLSDFGQSVNCIRIDELTADGLFERFCAHRGSSKYSRRSPGGVRPAGGTDRGEVRE